MNIKTSFFMTVACKRKSQTEEKACFSTCFENYLRGALSEGCNLTASTVSLNNISLKFELSYHIGVFHM